jgi:hypothetical protein
VALGERPIQTQRLVSKVINRNAGPVEETQRIEIEIISRRPSAVD